MVTDFVTVTAGGGDSELQPARTIDTASDTTNFVGFDVSIRCKRMHPPLTAVVRHCGVGP